MRNIQHITTVNFFYLCTMKVIKNTKGRKGNAWMAAVGFFDGVHVGHRYFIREMQQLASERRLKTAIFTFPVHPRIVLESDYRPLLLSSLDEKLKQLATLGVDYCVVLDFTPELSLCSAHDFIVNILSQQWQVRSLLIGYDHRFGHNRTDGFDEYVEYGKSCGMEVLQSSSYNRKERAVSSSQIRQLLSECRVEEAAKLLTYPYRLQGRVVRGRRLGRTMGFPTANLEIEEDDKVWPGMGVYAVWVYAGRARYKGMLAIGNRPTMDGDQVSVEVHLLHFDGWIYQHYIEVEFMQFMRENRKFDNLEALRVQLWKDHQQVEELLK
jgi:riboflavin kinase/FMN adenylyltransferase